MRRSFEIEAAFLGLEVAEVSHEYNLVDTSACQRRDIGIRGKLISWPGVS